MSSEPTTPVEDSSRWYFREERAGSRALCVLVRVEARLLELVVRDGVFHAVYDELDPLQDLLISSGSKVWRASRAPRLVDQVIALSGRKRSGM